jgi:lactoylglutathione lyase
MIKGIFETHLHVRDLEKAADFYENVLELEPGHYVTRRRVKFYWVGGKGSHMLEDFHKTIPFLKSKGITPRNFDNSGEHPLVLCWMPAVSIYFTDPDGHSLEFLAMLPDEPKPDLNLIPWIEWEQMHGRSALEVLKQA